MDEAHPDLKHRVLHILYSALQRENRRLNALAGERRRGLLLPSRLGSHMDVEAVRREIRFECSRAGAPAMITEFFSTRWLERFTPTAM